MGKFITVRRDPAFPPVPVFWQAAPGETPLYRCLASFASGRADKVAGMRWFRDDGGRDIAADLPGWPSGPVYEKRGDRTVRAGKTLGFLGKAGVVAIAAAIEVAGGSSSSINIEGPDGAKPTDPALEVEDFPVLVGAPGTTARTVPWQLDPDRLPKDYRTHLQLTDQRILFLGSTKWVQDADVLWELPLTRVAGARRHAFSTQGGDVTVGFPDGSWMRLNLGSLVGAMFVESVLNGGDTTPAPLNPVQREKLDKLTSVWANPVLQLTVVRLDPAAGDVLYEHTVWVDGRGDHSAGARGMDAQGRTWRYGRERKPR